MHTGLMKRCILSIMASFLAVLAFAQSNEPTLEFVVELHVKCDGTYTVGNTSHGKRVVIPITGGTFQGPKMQGTIIPGGADYQLVDEANKRTELEAVYSIRTDDGVNIHVRNCGIIYDGKDADGNPLYYFKTSPKFEAPADSRYSWLNNAIFVCQPDWNGPKEFINLKVWMVK